MSAHADNPFPPRAMLRSDHAGHAFAYAVVLYLILLAGSIVFEFGRFCAGYLWTPISVITTPCTPFLLADAFDVAKESSCPHPARVDMVGDAMLDAVWIRAACYNLGFFLASYLARVIIDVSRSILGLLGALAVSIFAYLFSAVASARARARVADAAVYALVSSPITRPLITAYTAVRPHLARIAIDIRKACPTFLNSLFSVAPASNISAPADDAYETVPAPLSPISKSIMTMKKLHLKALMSQQPHGPAPLDQSATTATSSSTLFQSRPSRPDARKSIYSAATTATAAAVPVPRYDLPAYQAETAAAAAASFVGPARPIQHSFSAVTVPVVSAMFREPVIVPAGLDLDAKKLIEEVPASRPRSPMTVFQLSAKYEPAPAVDTAASRVTTAEIETDIIQSPVPANTFTTRAAAIKPPPLDRADSGVDVLDAAPVELIQQPVDQVNSTAAESVCSPVQEPIYQVNNAAAESVPVLVHEPVNVIDTSVVAESVHAPAIDISAAPPATSATAAHDGPVKPLRYFKIINYLAVTAAFQRQFDKKWSAYHAICPNLIHDKATNTLAYAYPVPSNDHLPVVPHQVKLPASAMTARRREAKAADSVGAALSCKSGKAAVRQRSFALDAMHPSRRGSARNPHHHHAVVGVQSELMARGLGPYEIMRQLRQEIYGYTAQQIPLGDNITQQQQQFQQSMVPTAYQAGLVPPQYHQNQGHEEGQIHADDSMVMCTPSSAHRTVPDVSQQQESCPQPSVGDMDDMDCSPYPSAGPSAAQNMFPVQYQSAPAMPQQQYQSAPVMPQQQYQPAPMMQQQYQSAPGMQQQQFQPAPVMPQQQYQEYPFGGPSAFTHLAPPQQQIAPAAQITPMAAQQQQFTPGSTSQGFQQPQFAAQQFQQQVVQPFQMQVQQQQQQFMGAGNDMDLDSRDNSSAAPAQFHSAAAPVATGYYQRSFASSLAHQLAAVVVPEADMMDISSGLVSAASAAPEAVMTDASPVHVPAAVPEAVMTDASPVHVSAAVPEAVMAESGAIQAAFEMSDDFVLSADTINEVYALENDMDDVEDLIEIMADEPASPAIDGNQGTALQRLLQQADVPLPLPSSAQQPQQQFIGVPLPLPPQPTPFAADVAGAVVFDIDDDEEEEEEYVEYDEDSDTGAAAGDEDAEDSDDDIEVYVHAHMAEVEPPAIAAVNMPGNPEFLQAQAAHAAQLQQQQQQQHQ
ncbi:hypothetical protein H9P43_007409 [Blastocladiella emersonii ATCC 22665]|nr:hypothetical protein H9P43_007388 [Blastocladiella emersonii ATCC 22665]KAI9173278.1 hypothetical protein H9P43_007409 [Blastocladiella emersonii ATCC 22665]